MHGKGNSKEHLGFFKMCFGVQEYLVEIPHSITTDSNDKFYQQDRGLIKWSKVFCVLSIFVKSFNKIETRTIISFTKDQASVIKCLQERFLDVQLLEIPQLRHPLHEVLTPEFLKFWFIYDSSSGKFYLFITSLLKLTDLSDESTNEFLWIEQKHIQRYLGIPDHLLVNN